MYIYYFAHYTHHIKCIKATYFVLAMKNISFPKFLSLTASKDNKLWDFTQQLQNGLSWHWTKPFLMFETRFVQPTCLGLPVEISKYYSTLAAVTVNGNNYSHSGILNISSYRRQQPTKTQNIIFFYNFSKS